MPRNDFTSQFQAYFEKSLPMRQRMIGELVVNRIRKMLRASVGGSKTDLEDTIKYKIDGNDVIIYSDNKITMFLDKGTKPHKIHAKPGKSLAFRAGQSNSATGTQMGDTIFAKSVDHPGFVGREFFTHGVFLSVPEIKEIMKNTNINVVIK